MPNGDSVELKTGLFGLALKGGNAFAYLIVLLLVVHAALGLWEHHQREDEHEQIICSLKLAIFIYTLPKGTPVDWDRMPVDLYPCVPSFLYSRPVK